MSTRRVWTQEEDSVIRQLVEKYGVKNWADIAAEMASIHGFRGRSGKQCRQRWHNHIDPVICKHHWSKQQEEIMFAQHKIHGNRWTLIAEHLPGRTDNSIKNYFYSTIRRSLRRMNKLIGMKNSTAKMKWIKPSTLSKIFSVGINDEQDSEPCEDEGMREERQSLRRFLIQNCLSVKQQIMEFTNYKPKRKDSVTAAERDRFIAVIDKMEKINQIYQKIKSFQKKQKMQQMQYKDQIRKLNASSSSEEEESNQSQEMPIQNQINSSEIKEKEWKNRRPSSRKMIDQKEQKVVYTRSKREVKPPRDSYMILDNPIQKSNSKQSRKATSQPSIEVLTMANIQYKHEDLPHTLQHKQQIPSLAKNCSGLNLPAAHLQYYDPIPYDQPILTPSRIFNPDQPSQQAFFIQIKDQVFFPPLPGLNTGASGLSPGYFFNISPTASQYMMMMSPAGSGRAGRMQSSLSTISQIGKNLSNGLLDDTCNTLKKQIQANNQTQLGRSTGAFKYCQRQG